MYYSQHFDVYADFNPLNYFFTTTKLNATEQRWVNELSNFSFDSHYKQGVENVAADSLSRYPRLDDENLTNYNKTLYKEDIKNAFDAVVNQQDKDNGETWVAAINTISMAYDQLENQILYKGGNQSKPLSSQEIAQAQSEEKWIKWVKDQKRCEKQTHINRTFNIYLQKLKFFYEIGTT